MAGFPVAGPSAPVVAHPVGLHAVTLTIAPGRDDDDVNVDSCAATGGPARRKGLRMTARRARTLSGPIAVATAAQRRRRDTGPLTDKGQARKAELLAAAWLVFERQGFLDARVADIVAEANVAQGSFCTYFDSCLRP